MDETLLLPTSVEPHEIVYRDHNQTIQRVVARFDRFDKEYFVSDHGERAALVAIRGREVLLTRQYRLLINGLSCEIPGGRVDDNESPEDAAIRECLEETGIRCANLKPLIAYHPSLDVWKNFTRIFYSEEYREMSKELSDHRIWVPLAKCIEMIFSRQISDSMSIAALLAYQVMISTETHR